MSDYSPSDSGYRKLAETASVTAADGTTTTDIEVSWTAIDGADSYELYRSESSASPGSGNPATITGIVGTSHTDTDIAPDVYAGRWYYYWVRGVADSSGSTSEWSTAWDDGYKMIEAPVVTFVSDGLDEQEVHFAPVNGTSPVEGATEYRVFYSDDYGDTFQLYGASYTCETSPYGGTGGEKYHYYFFGVKAYSSGIDRESEMSDVDLSPLGPHFGSYGGGA